MTQPQNSPEGRINQDAGEGQWETQRSSVLVSFALVPGKDTSHLPSQLRLDEGVSAMFYGFMESMVKVGLASVGIDQPEEQLIGVYASSVLKTHEQDGYIGVYERMRSGDLKLEKNFPDRDAAEAYIEGIRNKEDGSGF